MYFVAQSHISQILIPYLLGFLGVYYRNLLLPLNRSICSSKRKAEKRNTMIGTSQWTAQSSRNYGILSFKRRSVLDAWSSNIITDKIRCTIVFPLRARATFGGVLLQVVIALKNIRLLVCAFSCFWMLNACVSGCPWSPVSAISCRVNVTIKIFLYSIFYTFWTT